MSELELGKVIGKGEKVYRDAVHIAVCPVIALQKLSPGQDVGIHSQEGEEIIVSAKEATVGIVDPYLPGPVYKGDRFYIFLYPNTVTSLRHEWVHPDFHEVKSERSNVDNSNYIGCASDPEGVSKRWLEYFAKECELSYDQLMDATKEYLDTGEDHCLGTDTPDICYTENDEFWKHYQKVVGKIISGKEQINFFRCAC